MGIGTSDGKYYPNEMEMTLHEMSNADVEDLLDPTGPFTNGPEGFDDSPTRLQRARDGSVINNLKMFEGQMEDNLNNYKPGRLEDELEKPPVTPIADKKPEDVLSTFQGNHEGALIWGEREHQEAYVERYGYEQTLDVLNSALEQSKALKGNGRGGGAWYKELEDYRDELLARQGS